MSITPKAQGNSPQEQRKQSKLKDVQFKMKQKFQVSNPQSPQQTQSRFGLLENKLGLKALSRSDRFEVVLKEFKGLDTFFTINELLQELNFAGVDNEKNEIQREKIKLLLEQEKIKQWKTQFPQHLEFESNTRYSVKSELLQKARGQLNLQKYEPHLYETVTNLKSYLKDKFKNIDLRENPQLQLFKDISEIKPLEIEQIKRKVPVRLNTFIESQTLIQQQKEKEEKLRPQDYYDQFQQEADKLRIRLRDQQLDFFNKKWGNSVVKMKIKDQQFKRQAQNTLRRMPTLKLMAKDRKKKAARDTITDPYMKEIISDVCYEEAEMMEERKDMEEMFNQMRRTHDQLYKKYEEPDVIGLRILTK